MATHSPVTSSTFANSRLMAAAVAFIIIIVIIIVLAATIRTLRRFGHGRAQAVHVVASVTVVAEEQLVLKSEEMFRGLFIRGVT